MPDGRRTASRWRAALGALPAGGLRLILDPEGELAFATLVDRRARTPCTSRSARKAAGRRSDREQLRAAGFQGLRLGPRILRTETAGLAAIAALQARFGDFR